MTDQETIKKDEVTFNPNSFSNTENKPIDYDKIVTEFGLTALDSKLLERMEKLSVKPLHPFLKREIFFCHRDLDVFLNAVEKKEQVYLYTGRGPSQESMHLGHLLPFIFCKYLQDSFDVPIVIQITDDEKYFYQKPKAKVKKGENREEDLDWFSNAAIENIKDIIACGFNEDKTFIFRDTDYIGHMYKNVVRMQKHITYNQIKGIFGLNGTENSGKVAFPAIQAVPCMSTTFPQCFDQSKKEPICLIPCGIDQDPYFRMTRDIAQRMKFNKPCTLYSKFFPALQGWNKKMSSSDPTTAVFLTDTPNQIKKKINKHAFSGGQVDIDTHRKLGADLEIDIAYNYLRFFMEDDQRLEEIGDQYSKGQLLTSEVKKELIDILQKVIGDHQERRNSITLEVVNRFMKVRPFK